MALEVPRPFSTVHLFGSHSSGKTSLKKQWFESSHSRVISEIADVHIRIQVPLLPVLKYLYLLKEGVTEIKAFH